MYLLYLGWLKLCLGRSCMGIKQALLDEGLLKKVCLFEAVTVAVMLLSV